ncbi:MAG: hypothetical protein ACQEQM_08830 [Thermoplasmatota archaeon]
MSKKGIDEINAKINQVEPTITIASSFLKSSAMPIDSKRNPKEDVQEAIKRKITTLKGMMPKMIGFSKKAKAGIIGIKNARPNNLRIELRFPSTTFHLILE